MRINAEFLRPVEGKMYLANVDAYLKWIDLKEMGGITADSTMEGLRKYFSVWGLLLKLITSNGPSFCASKFEEFMLRNGVQHIRTAPYHLASNGSAETIMRTFKSNLKLLVQEGNS